MSLLQMQYSHMELAQYHDYLETDGVVLNSLRPSDAYMGQ